MSTTGITEIDQREQAGVRAAHRLRTERVGWVTTVADDGTPVTSPIWFTWSGDEILMYSLKSNRVRNISERTRVSFNLDGDGLGGNVVVIEGDAWIDRQMPSASENAEFLAKYQPVLDQYRWTPEWFADRYSVPIRITPTKYRYW